MKRMADDEKRREAGAKSRRDFFRKATIVSGAAAAGIVAGTGKAEAQGKPLLPKANINLDTRAATRSADDPSTIVRGAILAKAAELARTYGGRDADNFFAKFGLSWP